MRRLFPIVLLFACDAQVDGSYQGEPLGSVSGGIQTEQPLDGEATLLWWTPGDGPLVRTPIPVRGEFPAGFSIDLFAPPPASVRLDGTAVVRAPRVGGDTVVCRGAAIAADAVAHVAVIDDAGRVVGLDEQRVLTWRATDGYDIASLRWSPGDTCAGCDDGFDLALAPHRDGLDARLALRAASSQEACHGR